MFSKIKIGKNQQTLTGRTASTGPRDKFPALGSNETAKSMDSFWGRSLILSNSILNPVDDKACLSAVKDTGIKLGLERMHEFVFIEP